MPPRLEKRERNASDGRPLPRRLFSLDALKNSLPEVKNTTAVSASPLEKEESNHSSHSQAHTRNASSLSPAFSDDPFADAPRGTQESIEGVGRLSHSPAASEFDFLPKSAVRTLSSEDETKSSRFRLTRPPALGAGPSRITPETHIPVSPSRLRWEHLRQAVLPIEVALAPPAHESTTPATRGPPVPRIAAPAKPSRFAARLGFRQATSEHTRTATAISTSNSIASVSSSLQFAEELRKACWAARFSDVPLQRSGRREREATDISLAAVPLRPFIVGPGSLTSSPNTSALALPLFTGSKQNTSRTATVSSGLRQTQATSVGPLHQTLMHYASMVSSGGSVVDVPTTLPRETDVFSALLTAFLPARNHAFPPGENEQQLAVEAFEVAVKTWRALTPELELQRALWVCRAAPLCTNTGLRAHLVGILYSVLFPRGREFKVAIPYAVHALLAALHTLHAWLNCSPAESAAVQLLDDVLGLVERGELGGLSSRAVEEEYKVHYADDEDSSKVFMEVMRGAPAKALLSSEGATRLWLLENTIEERWSFSDLLSGEDTPLVASIAARNRASLAQSLVHVMRSSDGDARTNSAVLRILSHLLRLLDHPISEMEDAQARTAGARVFLEVFSSKIADSLTIEMLCGIFRHPPSVKPWTAAFVLSAKAFMSSAKWPAVIRLLCVVTEQLPEDVKKIIFLQLLPALNERLAQKKSETDLDVPRLKAFLVNAAQLHPAAFFKPLFACAAAMTQVAVVPHLRVLRALSNLIPDVIWMTNAEMISMVIGGEFGVAAGKKRDSARPSVRLGQTLLALEMVTRLRAVREARGKGDMLILDHAQSLRSLMQFAVELETRLGVLLEAKEKKGGVNVLQRALFCALFLETRLIARSLKSSTWLSRVISWTVGRIDEEAEDDFGYYGDVDVGEDDELQVAIAEARAALLQGVEGRASDPFADSPLVLDDPEIGIRLNILDEVGKGLIPIACGLLVAVSPMIGAEELRRLGKAIWEELLLGSDSVFVPKACFLIMQFADKAPQGFTDLLKEDFQSAHPVTRRNAIQKLSVLFARRFQILSQTVITDRAHPRPFRSTRPQVKFVPTDVGSSRYVAQEADEFADGTSSGIFKQELQKTLREMGWDREGPGLDLTAVWRATPLALLPVRQLQRPEEAESSSERASPPASPATSPLSSPKKLPAASPVDGLLRRNSSSSSPGGRRRAVYVPAVTNIVFIMASLVYDPDYKVAAEAHRFILDLMKEDPSAAARPIDDYLDGDEGDVTVAMSSLRAYTHVARVLPPGMAYHAFNHLAGILRHWRQPPHPNGLALYAQTAPLLAKTMTQVSNASIRELRRAKIESFLTPTGTFWFPPSAPEGTMFPRSLAHGADTSNTHLASQITQVAMIRISQNMFLFEMLKRSPQDIQAVRKTLSRLVLPTRDGAVFLPPPAIADFIPRSSSTGSQAPTLADVTLQSLSLALSRSYILLVMQIFRTLTRHLADREELAVYTDSLNRILLHHGNDSGIVTQVMTAFMVACTRFRRLFTSQGYILFMPAVLKVYVECLSTRDLVVSGSSESPPLNAVRDAIEHAVVRFYALHTESFVFQTLVVLSRMMHLPNFPADWASKRVFKLLTALERGPPAVDSSGIRGINRQEEQEAIIARLAEETPQFFFASVRRGAGVKGGKSGEPQPSEYASASVDEYELKRLGLDNIVRLLLTVIAHNPTVLRAEQFVRLLAFLAPQLCGTSASTVLRDGIDALGVIILTRLTSKTKIPDGTQLQPLDGSSVEAFVQEVENEKQSEVKSPADLGVMRMDYLSLVLAFVANGGHLSATTITRVVEIIRLVGSAGSDDRRDKLSSFLSGWTRATLIREPLPEMRTMVGFLSNLTSIFPPRDAPLGSTLNIEYSGIFDALAELSSNPVLASNLRFEKVIVNDFCSIGISLWLSSDGRSQQSNRLRNSVLSLIHEAICFPEADVIGEVEKCAPTSLFLADFVLPLIFQLKTFREITHVRRWVDGRRHSRAWGRLLGYVISAADKSDDTDTGITRRLSQNTPRRSVSRNERPTASQAVQSHALKLLAVVQIIKIIVSKADDDLSEILPGLWPRLGQFISSLIRAGNAHFATQAADNSHDQSLSVPPTPFSATNPPTPTTGNTDFSFLSVYSGPGDASSAGVRAWPRLVDYLLWSFLELLCHRRTPLLLQLRLLMQERTGVLYLELQAHNQQQSRVSPQRSPISERPMSLPGTAFTKPRRRSASGLSTPQSPSRGAYLSISASSSSIPPVSTITDARQAGYNRISLASPGEIARAEQRGGPKIVHLGPVQNRIPSNTLSASGAEDEVEAGAAQSFDRRLRAAKALEIQSEFIRQKTCRSVRVVQSFMGYSLLVPPPTSSDSEAVDLQTWSRQRLIECALEEMEHLVGFLRTIDGE